jgi:hypothetical protein
MLELDLLILPEHWRGLLHAIISIHAADGSSLSETSSRRDFSAGERWLCRPRLFEPHAEYIIRD